jgi:hypothetical protein
MKTTKHLTLIGAIALLGACTEPSAPPAAPSVDGSRQLHSLRWKPGATPRFAVTRPAGDIGAVYAAPPAPSELSTNQVSFWAYMSQDASVQVDWLDADSTWQPYVSLSVPAGSLLQRPDGSFFAAGDSIEITLTFDTTEIVFEAEPSGLVFNPLVPATLQVWYGGTDPDFNGDGVLNWLDNYIENVLLGLYTRQDPDDDWSPLSAVQSLLAKRFTASLLHFCGYAVDW